MKKPAGGEDEPDRYEMNDTVGKSGIEKVMETYLQGEKRQRNHIRGQPGEGN